MNTIEKHKMVDAYFIKFIGDGMTNFTHFELTTPVIFNDLVGDLLKTNLHFVLVAKHNMTWEFSKFQNGPIVEGTVDYDFLKVRAKYNSFKLTYKRKTHIKAENPQNLFYCSVNGQIESKPNPGKFAICIASSSCQPVYCQASRQKCIYQTRAKPQE